MRQFLFGLVSLFLFTALAPAASVIVPAGYQVTDLGISAPAFGASADGRLATATYSGNTISVTLYDTYQAGRQVIGTATITGPSTAFATDIAFGDNNTIYLGDNGGGDTLHKITFSPSASPGNVSTGTVDSFANGSFNGIQAIGIRGNTMTVTGTDVTDFSSGNYYLKTLNLSSNITASNTITNSGISTIDSGAGIGSGYVGGTVITASGKAMLLDSFGSAFLYDLVTGTRANRDDIALGTFSAYAAALDNENNAYISAGGEIKSISDVDGANILGTLGTFTGNVFLSGIAYTGNFLQAFQGQYNGTLLVNYTEFDENFNIVGSGILAISALPEPATLSLLALGSFGLLARRRVR